MKREHGVEGNYAYDWYTHENLDYILLANKPQGSIISPEQQLDNSGRVWYYTEVNGFLWLL